MQRSTYFVIFGCLLLAACAVQSRKTTYGPEVFAQCDTAFARWQSGSGVVATPSEMDVCEAAAQSGNVDAMLQYGFAFMKGIGVQKDAEKGVFWFAKAAEKHSADALYNLGYAYLKGQGVERSNAKAAHYFLAAAKQDDAGAQFNVGLMYRDGTGLPMDIIQAYAWFGQSARNGNASAAKARDEIASRLTPAQLAQVKAVESDVLREVKKPASVDMVNGSNENDVQQKL